MPALSETLMEVEQPVLELDHANCCVRRKRARFVRALVPGKHSGADSRDCAESTRGTGNAGGHPGLDRYALAVRFGNVDIAE